MFKQAKKAATFKAARCGRSSFCSVLALLHLTKSCLALLRHRVTQLQPAISQAVADVDTSTLSPQAAPIRDLVSAAIVDALKQGVQSITSASVKEVIAEQGRHQGDDPKIAEVALNAKTAVAAILNVVRGIEASFKVERAEHEAHRKGEVEAARKKGFANALKQLASSELEELPGGGV